MVNKDFHNALYGVIIISYATQSADTSDII